MSNSEFESRSEQRETWFDDHIIAAGALIKLVERTLENRNIQRLPVDELEKDYGIPVLKIQGFRRFMHGLAIQTAIAPTSPILLRAAFPDLTYAEYLSQITVDNISHGIFLAKREGNMEPGYGDPIVLNGDPDSINDNGLYHFRGWSYSPLLGTEEVYRIADLLADPPYDPDILKKFFQIDSSWE